jgi:hypothetical protein
MATSSYADLGIMPATASPEDRNCYEGGLLERTCEAKGVTDLFIARVIERLALAAL